jgi:hypothetical protein
MFVIQSRRARQQYLPVGIFTGYLLQFDQEMILIWCESHARDCFAAGGPVSSLSALAAIRQSASIPPHTCRFVLYALHFKRRNPVFPYFFFGF